MLTLLIDNYDSFTYNLFQLLAEENGREPIVVRNDEASWEELARLEFDNVVLSPGPGRPERERDFGVCAEAIRRCEAPLLGVCLGHQGLGWVHGGRVVPAPEPMHGRVRAVEHAGAPLFAGIPTRFEATRYHSLCLERPLPDELEEIAWSDDGVVMALAHRTPPPVGRPVPPRVDRHRTRPPPARQLPRPHGRQQRSTAGADGPKRASVAQERDEMRRQAGRALRAEGAAPGPSSSTPSVPSPRSTATSSDAFWLDSSSPANGGRFSFMGDASGPLGGDDHLRRRRPRGHGRARGGDRGP